MPFRKLRAGFLGTRVGRQTLLHFLGAALVPVLVSSLLGIWYVRQTLVTEAAERVDRTAESAGLILLRQLTVLARETKDAPAEALLIEPAGDFSSDELAHLRNQGVLLRLPGALETDSAGTSGGSAIRLVRQTPDGSLRARRITTHELWDPLNELIDGDRTTLCVFTMSGWKRLHCSDSVTSAKEEQLRRVARASSGSGTAVAPERGSANGNEQPVRELLAAHRDLYLRYELASAEWRLVTSEDRALALAPASSVTTSLCLLFALAMVSAFTFAHRQIRRSTQPLEALRDATKRVEAGDLDTLVVISSRDEYGELGLAFNGMTNALSRQLTLLRVMDDVDQATLRHREIEAIAAIALDGLRNTRGLTGAACAIVDEYSTTNLSCWSIEPSAKRVNSTSHELSASDRQLMLENPRQYALMVNAADHNSGHRWIPDADDALRIVFPLINDGELLGAISVSFASRFAALTEELMVVRRIADRVGLGIANVRLLDRLNALSSGTLLAFARAIDANSPWTAGHSERVTQLAIGLGRQLELAPAELSTLYRGGLMHDIGKIGIPPAVLDKAGRLDDTERAIIEKHPEIGERILRPIPAFADALGIVRSHHERFDGTGYPDRLAGENIPWLARILAVADVFDAMASDRPYRAGLSHRATITMIEGNSGTHFDPRVVEALLALERNDPKALTQQISLREFTMQGSSSFNTPHNAMVAIR
ncbi:MAG: HD domain-containing protein [Phycisphaerae bacterium]|nr:HD domain-containing protein [Gemmatimonadaceae bacterium]